LPNGLSGLGRHFGESGLLFLEVGADLVDLVFWDTAKAALDLLIKQPVW
jgi:hypothetical protein